MRALRHVVHALLDDAQALAHLLDATTAAVVAVAMLAGGDVELELLVARIGPLLAKIPFEAARPQIRVRSRPTRSPHPSCKLPTPRVRA